MSKSNDLSTYKSVLVLGGTAEARQLADVLCARGVRVTTSLAGRTKNPALPEGDVRIGGFGGPEGLAGWILDHDIDLVIDATHPFAAQISLNAVAACAAAGVRLVRLERPAWTRPKGARWIELASISDAAAALPKGANAFLTIGRQDLAPFFARKDCRFAARMIDAPENVPPAWTVITERGPFALEGEIALFQSHGFTHIVSKNSGGDETRAKIDAAAQLGIPIVMVSRPDVPAAETVASVQALLDRLAEA